MSQEEPLPEPDKVLAPWINEKPKKKEKESLSDLVLPPIDKVENN